MITAHASSALWRKLILAAVSLSGKLVFETNIMKSIIFIVFLALSPFWKLYADDETRSGNENERLQARSININGFFDKVISRLADSLKENGFDPYALQDYYFFNLTFVDLLHIKWYTRVAVFDGKVHHLTSIHRDGEATLGYNKDNGSLELQGQVAFDSILVDYSFVAQALNVGPSGAIHATVEDLRAKFTIGITSDFSAKLQEFEIENVRNIDVKVTGFGLVNPLASSIANAFTDTFKNIILKIVENEVREEAEKAVSSFKPGELLG